MTNASGGSRSSGGGRGPSRWRADVRNARGPALAALTTLCALIGVLAFSIPSARAAGVRSKIGAFGPEGPGSGAFSEPQSIAVEQGTGDIYVYEAGKGGRIYKFDAAGAPANFSTTNVIESVGGAKEESEIAVDSSSGPDKGDIYVATGKKVEIYSSTGAKLAALTEKEEPCGVAVDASGAVYVAFYGEEAIKKYTPITNPVSEADYTSSLSEVDDVCNIAADSEGNVYAAHYSGGADVKKYLATEFNTMGVGAIGKAINVEGATLAVDPVTGDVYVDEESEIAVYTPSGTKVEAFGSLNGSYGVGESHASGDVYVSAGKPSEVDIYGPAPVANLPEVELESVSELQPTSATLNGTVNPKETSVTACEFEYGTEEGIYAHSVACSNTVPFAGDSPVAVSANVGSLTPDTTYYYRLSATNTNGTSHTEEEVFETSGPPTIVSESSEVSGRSTATVKAQITTRNVATQYHFEYGPSESYGASAPVPDGLVGGSGSAAAGLTGLSAGTTYHFRVVATNADSPNPVYGPDQTFTTLPPAPPALAVIESDYAFHVADTTAKLGAQINPENSDTHAYFQYGAASCAANPSPCGDMPAPPGSDLGSGESERSAELELQGLSPSTVYHYRVVASNGFGTEYGVEHTFTTQPEGSSLQLPDGRAWELVSPPDKRGALIRGLHSEGGAVQASVDGSAITYLASLPTESEPSGYSNSNRGVQVLSRRGQGGWSSVDIATAHESATAQENSPEYQFFSSDLSLALVDPISEDPTLLSARASAQTPYIRNQALCEQEATASECYLPLFTGKAGYADVPPGAEFGITKYENGLVNNEDVPRLEGATPSMSHVVVQSETALTATPTKNREGKNQVELYEWPPVEPAGEAELVSALPASEGGGPFEGLKEPNTDDVSVGGALGYNLAGARNAISEDGSRVFWEAGTSLGGERALYMRDTAKGETIRLDVPQSGAPSGETPKPQFEIASGNGSRVFFRDSQRLTGKSGHGDLYECEIVEEAGNDKCKLTDLTPEYEGQSAEVRNLVLGAGEEGSYVYFVANGVLAEGATPGSCVTTEIQKASDACNLYVAHEEDGKWTTTFIATLSIEDEYDWGGEDEVFHFLGRLTARVSPNGRYLAFMSSRSLTGYGNLDARSGKPDEEVYLYDAQAPPGTPSLICASCDPTGARPMGIEVGQIAAAGDADLADVLGSDGGVYGEASWVAADLPGGTALGEQGDSLYQSRLLFDSGRLFFDSSDALVPQDVDGTEDVYEYEPPGVGSCEMSSVTYSSSSGGCVDLISAGTSPVESGFLDASESGNDVFFLTDESLVLQDTDTAVDVYDAHVCTTQAPCTSAPVSLPECTTAEACRAAPSSQPAIFGAPSSQTFSGPGNTAPVTAAPKKSAAQIKAEALARALKACRAKAKSKRGSCEVQARRRYGSEAKALKACKSKRKSKRERCEAQARKLYGSRSKAKRSSGRGK